MTLQIVISIYLSYSGLDNRKNRKVRKHGNKLDVFKDYYTDSSSWCIYIPLCKL